MDKDALITEFFGELSLELNDYPVKLSCEGQVLEVRLFSLAALLNLIRFGNFISRTKLFQKNQKIVKELTIFYYLNKTIVAKSSPDIKESWMGRYAGIAKTELYFSKIFRSLFSLKVF